MCGDGRRNDLDAHFSYVCSDLSMNRGAFDAENDESTTLAPPSDDRRDCGQTDQIKMPRLYDAHLGCFVLQSAQTSTYHSAGGTTGGTCVADRCLAARPARATASGYALLGFC